MGLPFSDVGLARRLERAERDANARFVEARAAVDAARGAAWRDVNGTYALFDGPESPCTQTFGFGLIAAPAADDLDAIERFFAERCAPVFHEISPLADPAHLELLGARAYRPVEMSSVLYRAIRNQTASQISGGVGRVSARRVAMDERDLWARTLAAGWSDVADVSALIGDLANVLAARADIHLFIAEASGRPVAAGSLSMSGGVALLAGASTIPDARRQGAQSALLAARLGFAAALGCDLAMVVALPGSGSQRNAERNGFRIAYTRTKWRKP